MTDQNKEIEQLNLGRVIRAEMDVLLPLIQKHRENAIARMIGHWRAGEDRQALACVASIASMEDIRMDMKTKIAKAEAIERKMYADGTN